MGDCMNNSETIMTAIDQFSMLWRVKTAQPENTENKVLDKELRILEIKLHALHVNTDALKV